MPRNADHVADANGTELFRYSQLYEFPDFVKKADEEMTFRPGRLAVSVYADIPRQQFPCHNAASTWLSALYFTEKAAEFHPKDRVRIQACIDHHVQWWGIKAAVDRLVAKHAEYAKAANSDLPDSAYAYVWTDTTTGRKERHLRMTSAMEVKQAGEYLRTYRDRFTFADRHVMSKRILEKAARFGAGLGDLREDLEKQAGFGVCDPDKVVAMLQDRARLASVPAMKEHIVKLAATVANQQRQALVPEMLIKLAETVDDIDRGLGLYGKHTAKIPRPEDVIFEATFTKAASEVAEIVPLTSGKAYNKSDFAKVAIDDVRSLFGDSFVAEIEDTAGKVDPEKMAELVRTLPRGDSELFDGLMRECSISPVMSKAASVRQGFGPEDFAKLAEAYLPNKQKG